MPVGSLPDLLRLAAVPVLGYAAWRDVRTRRVPNATWLPLAALGVALLVHDALVRLPFAGIDDRWFLLRVGLSLGFVAPAAYVFWRLGGFGGADAKAVMTIAVLFPAYPTYYLPTAALPLERTTIGVFSMTVLTNAVLAGLAYPLALGARNALAGERSPLMFLGRRVPVERLPEHHGRLFETREGATRSGLDLDALRMYLRWRGTSLAALRAAPDAHRDPSSVGPTYDPGDGAVGGDAGPADGSAADPAGSDGGRTRPRDGPRTPGEPGDGDEEGGAAGPGEGNGDGTGAADGGRAEGPAGGGAGKTDPDDRWAAAAFLDAIEGDAYGTTPETLREGLETVVERDEVLISPGIPFLVPTFVGLVVGLTYGDLLFGLLSAAGVL
ncbi:MAG: prepilin peptidase [Haloferacaceae archaeon]